MIWNQKKYKADSWYLKMRKALEVKKQISEQKSEEKLPAVSKADIIISNYRKKIFGK